MEKTPRTDIDVLGQLNALSSSLWQSRDLHAGLEQVLEAIIALLGANKGNVQLLAQGRRVLNIVAHRGFERDFLEFFRDVSADDDTACGRVLRSGELVIIEDVEIDEGFAPFRAIARAADYRAVLSMPLIGRGGEPLGVLSTHFCTPHRSSEADLRWLDLHARQASDFIERLRSDDALRESEERFARFMHYLPGLAWIKDAQGRYLFANDAAERAFRTPRAELIGRTDAEIFPAVTATQFIEHDRRALEGGTGVQVTESLMQSDGMVHHSIVSKFPMPAADGTTFVGGMAIDITEHRRAQDALRESEERYRILAEGTPVLIWVNGLDGCEFVNRTYLDFIGVADADVRGEGWVEYTHPEDRDAYLASYRHAMGARSTFEAEVRFRRHDGEYRWMRSVGRPRFGEDGDFIGYAGSSVDVTDRKRAEEELKDADRRKDQFLATLAHELRNPLAPLRNGLEVMKLTHGDIAAQAQVRAMMERQLGQMVRLIDDLLDVSRISRGVVTLRKEHLEIAEVVRHAVEAARPAIEQARLSLTIGVPPEPIYLDGDATRLAQVFSNLLSNAAKFTEPGGQVWLTMGKQGNEAIVSVRDSGVGIPPAMLGKVFDMFTQVDWSLDRTQGGLGIGLSLVKGLVEKHGGSVIARSDGFGKGSEFVVRLPVAMALVEEDAAAVPRTMQRAARRILVADDNRDAAESLAMILNLRGNDTRIAHDGSETLAVAEEFRPHIILLDIGMPNLNGCDVAERIRALPWGKDVLLVAVTGWGQEEIRRRCQDAGIDLHLVKPVDPEELERILSDGSGEESSPRVTPELASATMSSALPETG